MTLSLLVMNFEVNISDRSQPTDLQGSSMAKGKSNTIGPSLFRVCDPRSKLQAYIGSCNLKSNRSRLGGAASVDPQRTCPECSHWVMQVTVAKRVALVVTDATPLPRSALRFAVLAVYTQYELQIAGQV